MPDLSPVNGLTVQERDAEELVWVRLVARHQPSTLEQTAALLSISTERAEDFLERRCTEIQRAILRIKASGRGIAPQALRIVGKGMDAIEAAFDAGDIDVSEVNDLLKAPLRVLEAAERERAREASKTENLPVWEFIVGENCSSFIMRPYKPKAVDIEAREIQDDGGEDAI